MVQSNKILTVSYGTFSCTLEGFDDPFSAMKVIAEYFRDLAANDRYFGAEPPQPDADTLARMAEREFARHVDAQADGNAVRLRAVSPDPVVSDPAVPERVSGAAVPELSETDDAASPEPTTDTGPDDVSGLQSDVPTDAMTDTMADKIARIRAAIERNDAVAVPVPGADLPDEAADLADNATDEAMYDAAAEAIDPEEDTLAAVSAALSEPDATDSESPAPTTEAIADVPGVAEAQATGEDDANVFRSMDWEAEAQEADDSEIRNILSDLGPRSEAAIQARASGPVTRVIKVKRADLEKAIATGSLEEVSSEAPAAPEAAAPEDQTQKSSSLSAQDEADLQAELDAVAAELAEAQAALNPPDEAFAQTDAGDRARGSAGRIGKTQPDVSRLMAEADSKMHEPENSSLRNAYKHLRAAVAAAEAEETLSSDTGKSGGADAAYRNDLASVVRPRRPEVSGDPSRSRRPGDTPPAPLKLVAEQRIDAENGAERGGLIRPRRVSAEVETGDEPTGFVTFAREVGAQELGELLEAAAAYMSFVEGWEQFSRPQLMNRVKQVEKTGFNREDGLRTFGRLLREGKILKTASGRFTASDQIGYRPARKAAG